MPVYLPSSVIGNSRLLFTLGNSAELMGCFYPGKDHAQHIHQCLPCLYFGEPGQGQLHWLYGSEFTRHQYYLGDSNVLVTVIEGLGAHIVFTDLVAPGSPVLMRRMRIENRSDFSQCAGLYLFGKWNMGGFAQGNSVIYSRGSGLLIQSHREAALAVGGDALESWQCGKSGPEWSNNSLFALATGQLHCQDLEIGDVNWAVGFRTEIEPGGTVERGISLALGPTQHEAVKHFQEAAARGFSALMEESISADQQNLAVGLEKLWSTPADLPLDLEAGYKRSLLCLPLLRGEEGVPVAAPEFDPEFISCGGYGYHWPRDGAEYISGLLDSGYQEAAAPFFDWCALHQEPNGLWHQRYFLNGAPGPNWCLPPDMLQVDQVGAVLWAYGKWQSLGQLPVQENHRVMVERAAEYLLERQDPATGLHKNAFDTWESFVGSFTYSNAAIYAAFLTAATILGQDNFSEAAAKTKAGVLAHFVREDKAGYRYLVRGSKADGTPDDTVDSSALGALEPFGLLNLTNAEELALAEGTLRAVTERLEVPWQGGHAIRRFEGDGYVGGVPACVNTLWMARCCLKVAHRLREVSREADALALTLRAQDYLQVVLRRATPTGLLPELMQGPTGQNYWAAPHGWAMASFVSAVLALKTELASKP